MTRYSLNDNEVSGGVFLVGCVSILFLIVVALTLVGGFLAFAANTLFGLHWELGHGVLAALLLGTIASFFRRGE